LNCFSLQKRWRISDYGRHSALGGNACCRKGEEHGRSGLYLNVVIVLYLKEEKDFKKTFNACTTYSSIFKGTLQRYYIDTKDTENSKHIFPEKELRGHNPYSYIHVSVCDLYIPNIQCRSAYSAACRKIGGPIV
jgi:hypothetical protein